MPGPDTKESLAALFRDMNHNYVDDMIAKSRTKESHCNGFFMMCRNEELLSWILQDL